jgi:hypothetical protein
MTDEPNNEKPARRRLSYEAYTECWYVPGETHIVDLIHPDDGLTLHYSEDAGAIRARYADARRMTCNEAWTAIDAAALAKYKTGIVEVDETRFMDALNVLPPVGWTTKASVESFRISERIWGNITDIYARLGNRYFKLADDIRLPASTIAERVAAFAAANPKPMSVEQSEPQRTAETNRRLSGTPSPAAPEPGDGA